MASKKATGEIELNRIEIGSECRAYLQWYYAEGGNVVAHADFKGRIKKITNRGILFEKLYINFCERDGCGVNGKEEHVWIFDKKPFLSVGAKLNDCVQFTGLVYAYQRRDKSVDFSLKDCSEVNIIDEYTLPSDEQLLKQSADRLRCEVCLYTDHCDRVFCIMD